MTNPYQKPFSSAYEKGFEAFKNGKKESDNPYVDWRTSNGRESVTFSRAWLKAWLKGFRDAQNQTIIVENK